MDFPEEKRIDPENLNSCDKSESMLENDTDKMRIGADPHEEKVYCRHCGAWITQEEWEEVDLGEQMTGVDS